MEMCGLWDGSLRAVVARYGRNEYYAHVNRVEFGSDRVVILACIVATRIHGSVPRASGT